MKEIRTTVVRDSRGRVAWVKGFTGLSVFGYHAYREAKGMQSGSVTSLETGITLYAPFTASVELLDESFIPPEKTPTMKAVDALEASGVIAEIESDKGLRFDRDSACNNLPGESEDDHYEEALRIAKEASGLRLIRSHKTDDDIWLEPIG